MCQKRSPGAVARQAFTLIEVLVVVAIIALLVAILIPSLQNARAQAQTAACLANLKQIGAGMMMYKADHRGWLPVGPADRIRFYDPVDGKYHEEPGTGRKPYPSFNCAWGGKRAAYPHDFYHPPREETLKRPLTNYFYKGAGLDADMPVFECPADTGVDETLWPAAKDEETAASSGGLPPRLARQKLYTICGNSYYINPWAAPQQTSPKRIRDASKLIVAEDAPLYFSISRMRQLLGWHRRFSRHNTLFLDFHAANIHVDPRTYDPVTNSRIAARQYQGPGWFAINYFEIMDYYR